MKIKITFVIPDLIRNPVTLSLNQKGFLPGRNRGDSQTCRDFFVRSAGRRHLAATGVGRQANLPRPARPALTLAPNQGDESLPALRFPATLGQGDPESRA